jgi:serine/threonine-protein kinase
MLQIGDHFDQYQILDHLAQGGMSDIFTAFDLVNRRKVVIKVPDQAMLGDPAQYERFQRELDVMNTLDHPAILKGLGSGRHNRIPYLVTEFIEGQSLRECIQTAAPLPVEEALAIVRKIADGMAYCHENGVIHRDLKPENIFLLPGGQPVIMDFGLALTKSAHRVTYSNLSATMGTPDYMAPEQIDGQRGDARTDIYALGTILYEMLAGQTPFRGDTPMAVMAQHLQGVAPRLDRQNLAVTVPVAAIVAGCLQRQPEDRFRDMRALLEAIDHPEAVDLSILEKTSQPAGNLPSLEWVQTLKAVAIALGILAALVLLAIVLQAIR